MIASKPEIKHIIATPPACNMNMNEILEKFKKVL